MNKSRLLSLIIGGMAITTVVNMARQYPSLLPSLFHKIASTLSLSPFKDEEEEGDDADDVENSKEHSALSKECKREECCKGVIGDASLEAIEVLKFFALRNSIEYTEMKKELDIRPDIWLDILIREQELFKSYCRMLHEDLNKALCMNKVVALLKDIKETLLSCLPPKAESNAVRATEGALDRVNQLGSHPLFAHHISVATHYISRVGSGLSGIPACWLSPSVIQPFQPYKFLSKKYFGQDQALVAIEKALESSRDRNARRPLGIFLVHDPSALYWEDFAADLSCLLFATGNLSLRLDLSANVDTLLTSANNGKGKLCALFDNVKKRGFGIVVFENVHQAHDSVIDAICGCLTGGSTLDGTSVDLSRTIFIMVGCNFSDVLHCPSRHCALPPLFNGSSGRIMDLASDDGNNNTKCYCTRILRQVKDHLSAKLWDLLDDVVLFSRTAWCNHLAYARVLIREIAATMCGGRLIIYPSEDALMAVVVYGGHRVKRIHAAVKRSLEDKIVPTLKAMEDRKEIDENSIVFIDTYVETNDLSFRVEKVGSYLGDNIKSFSEFADGWMAMYLKGKVLEDNITSLRKRLVEIHTMVNAEVKAEAIPIAVAMQELIGMVDNAIDASYNLSSSTEVFGFSTEKADVKPCVSEEAKLDVESLRATITSCSARPEIIKVVEKALLEKIDALEGEGSRRSLSSYLLLGLDHDGKRELLVELERNFQNDAICILNINLSNFSNDHSLSHLPDSAPRSSSDVCSWSHLVENVRKHPYSILYFDQVERANMSVFNLLISLLVHGVSLDGEGNVVDFRQAVVIIVSDVGNKHTLSKVVRACLKKRKIVGGNRISPSCRQEQEGHRFRSELLRKVDEVIVFDPFTCEQLKWVVRIPIKTELQKNDFANTRALRGQLGFLFYAAVNLGDRESIQYLTFRHLLKRVTRAANSL